MKAHRPLGRVTRGLAHRPGPAPGCILGAILLACSGCVQPVPPEARQLLVNSKAAYERGDDAAAIRDASTFLDGYARSSLADVAHYLRGLAQYRQNDPAAAKADLKLAAEGTQRKDVRVGSLKALGDLAFEEGDAPWAETLYRQALEETDQAAKPADEICYRLGCALQYQGRWAAADEQFDRVMHAFAGTEIARRAERRVRCLGWTVQAGAYLRSDLARAEAARLRAAELPAATRPVSADGQLQFLVEVGRYDTYEQAAAALPAARRLRDDAFVVPTR